MTEVSLYLRITRRRAMDIPALSRLVDVFCSRFGIENSGDTHRQISEVITAMVGKGRVVEDGHKWWILRSPDPRLFNLLAILSDIGAYDVYLEER